jgi:hypothetical protein
MSWLYPPESELQGNPEMIIPQTENRTQQEKKKARALRHGQEGLRISAHFPVQVIHPFAHPGIFDDPDGQVDGQEDSDIKQEAADGMLHPLHEPGNRPGDP